MSWNKKYILHSESEDTVTQLHFSNVQIIGLISVSLIGQEVEETAVEPVPAVAAPLEEAVEETAVAAVVLPPLPLIHTLKHKKGLINR